MKTIDENDVWEGRINPEHYDVQPGQIITIGKLGTCETKQYVVREVRQGGYYQWAKAVRVIYT